MDLLFEKNNKNKNRRKYSGTSGNEFLDLTPKPDP